MTIIAVINESTLVSNEDVRKMTGAVQKQMTWHLVPAWNQQDMAVAFFQDKKTIPESSWVVSVMDNSTQAGALGYHSEDNDLIDGFVFAKPVLDNNGVALHDPKNPQNVSVASVLSHEVLEMFGDRFANFWAEGPSIKEGNLYALELGDPVEGDSYDIKLNDGTLVSVSNFVFPSWFNTQATSKDAPFDHLNKLSKPFSMTPGGYMIIMNGGTSSQVFGDDMPNWKQKIKKGEFARSQRLRK